MKKILTVATCAAATMLALALADTPASPRAIAQIFVAIDGTGSLLQPSPINPSVSQQTMLLSIVPDLLTPLRQTSPEAQLSLSVICHRTIFALEGGIKRSQLGAINQNVALAAKDCTRAGTRIDLALQDIAALAPSTPYVVAVLTDGVNETSSGLSLEQGFKALGALKANPPKIFAMIGINPEIRLAWQINAQKTFNAAKTTVIIGSNRDIKPTLTRYAAALK